jgi:hypothetical protein
MCLEHNRFLVELKVPFWSQMRLHLFLMSVLLVRKMQCAPILFVLEIARLLCNSGQRMRIVIVNEVIRLMRIMKWSTSPVGAW